MSSTPFAITPELAPAFMRFSETLIEFVNTKGGRSPAIPEDDPELAQAWRESLHDALVQDCLAIQGFIQKDHFGKKTVYLNTQEVEAMLRVCASIRLKIHSIHLSDIPDEALECGDVDYSELPPQKLNAFSIYIFLANLQEILVDHLMPE